MKFKSLPYSDRTGARITVMSDDGVKLGVLEVKVLRQGAQTVQEAAEAIQLAVMTAMQPKGDFL